MRVSILSWLLISSAALGQTPQSKAVFEAASIKPAGPMTGHSHSNSSPGQIQASMTLKSYIMMAYNLKAYQVTGGPNWLDLDGFAIVAKLENTGDADLPGKDQSRLRSAAEGDRMNAALQALLVERFQLKFHHEAKEMPAYGLTIAKGGLKLKEVSGEGGSGTSSNGTLTGRKLSATRLDMSAFAGFLARQIGAPVVDMTLNKGFFTFTMDWTPDDLQNTAASDTPRGPSIFTALQELGLKLEPRKAPVEIMVVDSAERPEAN